MTSQPAAQPTPLPPASALPDRIDDIATLEELLSRPDAATVADLETLDGDIMVLGVSGKVGPSLAHMAARALPDRRVIGVARFSDPQIRRDLDSWGVETIQCDMMDRDALSRLPRARNIVFMAGHKFGSSGNQGLTWAMNTYLPGLVAETFTEARFSVFSTGCVYPFVPLEQIGADEGVIPEPPGEYAQSCIGRERMFEHFSRQHDAPGRLIRLNYAIDMRYGVLGDIAMRIRAGQPIDLETGHVNVIWQGDANRFALRALAHGTVPAAPLNVSGPETLPVRWLAEQLAARMGIDVSFTGTPGPTAWLNNSAEAFRLFGYPEVPLGRMLDWVADWTARDMPTLGKPTKFETRDGRY
ncbi:NAD-dependent epimerase/dehydratase family protein [Pseudooceanicola aestuarii]|uniref:NAD-dependent epimerase/dehydratase family protein n=1 Tax=Pseudooceanicola aestuarii TaxID=2697319 RepID=UPI0013D25CCB|nr:NAD-dependent epimerase/dehydratase family protein [Pseudooceanicola aestuarii]